MSRSLGPAFGAISGVGIWLSLTVAIAFYLVGMGEFLAQITPMAPVLGAIVGGVLLTLLNVVGPRSRAGPGGGRGHAGRHPGCVRGRGAFEIEAADFTPFFPFGASPVLTTTALVVRLLPGVRGDRGGGRGGAGPRPQPPQDPDRLGGDRERAVRPHRLTIGGLFSQATIGEVRDPLTQAARSVLGSAGGQAITFAGLLATLSSATGCLSIIVVSGPFARSRWAA